MRAAFGENFERLDFTPAAEQRIELGVQWKGLRHLQTAADLSDGTLKFLSLLAVLANPSPPPLVVLEEPESNLHPAMLPIIAEYAVAAAERTQVVLTTHSPEFLDAFREPTLTVTVFGWQDGRTSLAVLEPNELEDWVHHYRLGEYLRSGDYNLLLKDRQEGNGDS